MEYLYIILAAVTIACLAVICGKCIAWGAEDSEEQRRADFHSGPGY